MTLDREVIESRMSGSRVHPACRYSAINTCTHIFTVVFTVVHYTAAHHIHYNTLFYHIILHHTTLYHTIPHQTASHETTPHSSPYTFNI